LLNWFVEQENRCSTNQAIN